MLQHRYVVSLLDLLSFPKLFSDRTNLSSSMSDQLSTIPDPRSHGAELRSRRFREGGRVRASKVKDGSSLQRNSEEWESAACWTTQEKKIK